jgi:hypothetical protein
MFKPNKRELQPLLISNINDLSENLRSHIENSWAATFHCELFYLLKEKHFSVLFADHPSRSNIPINWLIALEIIKSHMAGAMKNYMIISSSTCRYVMPWACMIYMKHISVCANSTTSGNA